MPKTEFEFTLLFSSSSEAEKALSDLCWPEDNSILLGCARNGTLCSIEVFLSRHDPEEIERLRLKTGALSATPAQPKQNDDRPQSDAVFT